MGGCFAKDPNNDMLKFNSAAAYAYENEECLSPRNAEYQYSMGLKYETGADVQPDAVAAADWYSKAAGQGHERAQVKVVTLLSEAAAKGLSGAQFQLGLLYEAGNWVQKDGTIAMGYFTKAAEQGHAQAKIKVNSVFRFGLLRVTPPTNSTRISVIGSQVSSFIPCGVMAESPTATRTRKSPVAGLMMQPLPFVGEITGSQYHYGMAVDFTSGDSGLSPLPIGMAAMASPTTQASIMATPSARALNRNHTPHPPHSTSHNTRVYKPSLRVAV